MPANEELSTEPPKFVEIEGLDENRVEWLAKFEQRLQSNPVVYLKKLHFMGSLATKDTIGHGEPMPPLPAEDVGTLPQSDLHHYFSARYDRHHELDKVTNAALGQDEQGNALLSALKNMTSESVKTGIQRSEIRANKDAPDARDAFRRYNLEFYLWRVLESHEAALNLETEVPAG